MCELVENLHIDSWESVLALYEDALKARANKLRPDKKKDLAELDDWYQNGLPMEIKSRKEKHITHAELCKLMKWKLTRGKFRPRLTELVKENTPELVKTSSTEAFQKLPDLSSAIKELTVLKAVGPATASVEVSMSSAAHFLKQGKAILAAGSPHQAGFMADESMHALGGLYPIKYDLPFYMNYMKKLKSVVKELNKIDTKKTWTPHKVELTLWTYQILNTLDPGKLESVNDLNQSDDSTPPKKKRKT